MTIPALVPERVEDVERIANAVEGFTFASPEPLWASLTGERTRAAGRLLVFVAAVGLGTGLAVWIVGSLLSSAIRGVL
jgi:hypothetical protein